MDGSLVVAIISLAVATLSLGWQLATHALTGGRLKVTFALGALADNGRSFVTVPIAESNKDTMPALARQGYGCPVVAVTATNRGRMPITVARWSVASAVAEFVPIADSIGTSLPHRLEPGESETWFMDLHHVAALSEASKAVAEARPKEIRALGSKAPIRGIVAKVELADGRHRYSGEFIDL